MRIALVMLVACSNRAPAPPVLANSPARATDSPACAPHTSHPLPPIGTKFEAPNLTSDWTYPDVQEGRAGNGTLAWVAVDEAAGESVVTFVDHESKVFLGAISIPADTSIDMDHVCKDGFVLEAKTAPPVPARYARVIVGENVACSAADWTAARKPDC